jgi:hypothetical protein
MFLKGIYTNETTRGFAKKYFHFKRRKLYKPFTFNFKELLFNLVAMMHALL